MTPAPDPRTSATGPGPLPPASDLLLRRDRTVLLAEILANRTAYSPDWQPASGGAGRGLAEILAGHLELLQQRLARVPDHRQAVLLDMLGESLLPAQGARTHVLMAAVPGTRGARVPKGTRIGASVPGRNAPVVFETQEDVAIAPATIVEVHSVVPGADAEQDHSADVLARRPLTLFGAPARVDRDLFVGHDELLAFDGRAVVELEIGLAVPATAPLSLAWSWWDGTGWRDFAAQAASALEAGDDDSVDGTAGLTRSGTVRLVAPCAASVALELDGRSTHWIRGRLAAPLDLPAGGELPALSRVRLRVVNEHRRLRVRLSNTGGSDTTLRVWWPDGSPSELTWHLVDLTPATRADGDIVLPPQQPASMTLPASVDGHNIRIGVSVKPSRAPMPPPPPPPPPGGPVPKDPRRVAFDTTDELTDPLLADPGSILDVTVRRGLPLDKAIADQRAADLSKTFAPLGPSPVRGTAFLFASATATCRPGSRVILVIERPETAAEEADELSGMQEGSVKAAQDLLSSIIDALGTGLIATSLASAVATLKQAVPALIASDPVAWYANVRTQIQASLNELRDAAASDHTVWGQVGTARTQLDTAIGAADARPGAKDARKTLGPTPTEIARVLADLAAAAEALAMGGAAVHPARVALETAIGTGVEADIATGEQNLHVALSGLLAGAQPFLPAGALPPVFAMDPASFVSTVQTRLDSARAKVELAQAEIAKVLAKLKAFNPADLVKAKAPDTTNQLRAPVVAWEYYDGSRWRALGAEGDTQVLALQASGSVRFTVPDDIADVDIDGDVRRWMRARLAEGSYSHLRLVSWTDKSGVLNFLPVVEPRAPMLDRVEVFYRHVSDSRNPGAVVVSDDHEWRDLTAALTWPGPGAAPFRPMPEAGPTLYLGLDGELPADRIGIWLRLAAASPWATPRRPVWEGFDGRAWVRLATEDGTDGLRRTGVVGLVWPGTAGAPGVLVTGALGRKIRVQGRGAALRFTAGDRLVLADLQGQEPVVVSSAEDELVTCRSPLSRAYSGAHLRVAPPARFGVPRTWLRAVFDRSLPAPMVPLAGLAAHAVEVAQVESLHDELLGSGDGSPSQVLVSRRSPVAGDADLEVRELDGDRADLDVDVLERTLVTDGIDPERVRLVHDSRTGRIREVWVPWAATSSLGSAGPLERVYVLDHAQGRFLFGGNSHGRPLPEGRDNARLRSYRTCDGAVGNVGAGTLTQLLSAVAAGEVGNPEAASGGADVELLPSALLRGPGLLRHRRLALTERDVEAIAVEASPAVVRARVVGAVDRFGRPAAGTVRVVVVPRDGTARPEPGPALLALVRDAVVAASPAVAARRVTVEGPAYIPIGVSATILPQRAGEAGPVRERVLRALEEFMHPLRGGPDGNGWEFGRGAYLSDIGRVLESVPGVDALADLVLTRDDVPVGDSAPVRTDQVVCAGPLVIRLGRGA